MEQLGFVHLLPVMAQIVFSSNLSAEEAEQETEIIKQLQSLAISYELFHHEAVFTVEEYLKVIPDNHKDAILCKNLFLKEKKKSLLFLIVADCNTEVRLKELCKFFGFPNGNLRFGPEDLLYEKVRIKKGSVTPFGCYYDANQHVQLVLDQSLLEKNLPVLIHPMHNKATVKISIEDVIKFCTHYKHPPQLLNFKEINNI